MNRKFNMPTPSIDATRHSLQRVTTLALAVIVVAVALFISYGPAVPTMAQAEPGAITSVTLDSHQPGQLVITWETPDPAPTDYRVRWAHTSLGFLSYKDSNEAQRANVYPAAGVNTLTINDLTPGDIYKVHLRARYTSGGGNNGPWSGPWTATTTQRVKNHPPAAPTGLTTSEVTHDSLILTWDNPNDANITGYRIQRGTDANSLHTIEANTGSPSTNYADSNVEPETTYHYAVLALSQDGNGAQSITSVTTLAEPESKDPSQEPVVQIDPITGLAESNVKHNSLILIWDDPNNDAITGYRILKGKEPDNLSVAKDDTGSTNTKYTDYEVEKATTYFYSVNALTTNGSGPRSHLDVTTPAESINSVPSQTEQTSIQTLVSSMDRTSHQMANLISRDISQEFQTGSNPKDYKLHSIDLYLTGRNPDLTVELRRDSAIGTIHATLTPSSGQSLGHDVYTFVPEQDTDLSANTHYWIVVKGTNNGWFKAKLGGNAAPVPGWKLADNYEFRPKYRYDEDGTQSINTSTGFFKVPGHMSVRINRQNNVATGQLTISGTPQTQQTLTVSTAGIDDEDGLPATFNYQWMRYSADGATFETNISTDSNEYTLVLEDEDKKIRVAISFIDRKDNDEGPFLSDAYPSGNTITAPLSYTMVSNTGQTVSNNHSGQISTEPHAQAFTTSGETAGYILSSVTVVSTDPEGDEFAVKICDVDNPTRACTELTPPTSFTVGPLVFNSPPNRTITLARATTYALLFRVAAGTTVTLPATAEDNEDPISLPGWSIRNKSQFFSNNQWVNHEDDVAYLITIKGEPTQISQASGRPTIDGNPSVGQVLTTSTDSITVPEGVLSNFSYQWKRLSNDGSTFEADIGNNSNQYTLTTDELDKKVQVEVSFVDTRGSVVGFPITSPAYPTDRAISSAPLISNTSQNGNSNAAMSTEVAQSFTTGPSPHGYQPSIIHDFLRRRRKPTHQSQGLPDLQRWQPDYRLLEPQPARILCTRPTELHRARSRFPHIEPQYDLRGRRQRPETKNG